MADALTAGSPPLPPLPCTLSSPLEPGFIGTAALIDGAPMRPVLAPPAHISRVYYGQGSAADGPQAWPQLTEGLEGQLWIADCGPFISRSLLSAPSSER